MKDEKKCLVSILISNYNYARFLKRAVKSAAEQTYPNIELLIIDDGSTDGSQKEIISIHSRFNNCFKSFEYIFLNKNSGKIHALNIGIQKINGYFTVILDADDYLSIDYIEKTSKLLLNNRLNNEKVGFIYTDCNLVDSNCKILEYGKSANFNGKLLQTMSYIPECGITLTEILKDAIPFDENIKKGTKHHKWCRLVDKGYIGVYLPSPLFFYRMHQNNLSGIGSKILDEIKINAKSSKILSGYWPLGE